MIPRITMSLGQCDANESERGAMVEVAWRLAVMVACSRTSLDFRQIAVVEIIQSKYVISILRQA